MRATARKSTVDHRVALALGLPVKTVRLITRTFFTHARECLVEYGSLSFPDFGRLRVYTRECPAMGEGKTRREHFVIFKKSLVLREAMKARNKEVPYGKVRSGRVANP